MYADSNTILDNLRHERLSVALLQLARTDEALDLLAPDPLDLVRDL